MTEMTRLFPRRNPWGTPDGVGLRSVVVGARRYLQPMVDIMYAFMLVMASHSVMHVVEPLHDR